MNHYKWLEKNLEPIMKILGFYPKVNNGYISAHGDKCYQYRHIWEKAGIPFHHGVTIYFLTYLFEGKTVRDTPSGWVQPDQWVISIYPKYKEVLEKFPTKEELQEAFKTQKVISFIDSEGDEITSNIKQLHFFKDRTRVTITADGLDHSYLL